MSPSGFLVIDKPADWTSHDVVAKARGMLATRRVGHAGTLDPMATGVLVLGVGVATRLLRFVEATRKRYEASIRFGAATDSLDATGTIIETADAAHLGRDDIEAALRGFVGEIEQVPPMVSSIKIGGERLHAKARRGEVIDRPPRRVTIHEATLTGFEPGEQPLARVAVECSPGTYIRSLADDLGPSLGTLAHLEALRRTAVGAATLADAIGIDAIDPARLTPILDALAHLPQRALDEREADAIRHGRRIEVASLAGPYLAVHDGCLIAVLRDDADGTRIEVGMPASG